MPSSPAQQTHVYLREVQATHEDSLSKIVSRIPPGSTVLDVGTGSGALARQLSKSTDFVIDGITYNEDEAQLARQHYRRLVVMDLERQPLHESFEAARYDVIVCADVLEHLRNAQEVLRALSALLKPGGVVLVSLPNVTHLGVILGLMAGRFVRTFEGLLDSTHVHFMDRIALGNLVQGAGLMVTHEDAVRRNLVQTEFVRLNLQTLPKVVRSYVLSLPDAEVYQFVWTLQPRSPDSGALTNDGSLAAVPPPTTPAIDQIPRFRAQLFLDRGNGFSEDDCSEAFGVQAEGLQTLVFPVNQGGNVQALRLDLSDRPGQIEFSGLVAVNATGDTVWSWSGDWAANQTYHQCDWTGVRGWLGGRIVRAYGDDPWVHIPLQSADWEGVHRVELCLSSPQPMAATDWPGLDVRQLQGMLSGVSSNLNALAGQTAERVATLEAYRASAQSLADFRQTDIDTLRSELAASHQTTGVLRQELAASQQMTEILRQELTASQQVTQTLRQDLEASDQTNNSMHLELVASRETVEVLRQELVAVRQTVEVLRQELTASQQAAEFRWNQVQAMLASHSWRLTAGLRWISRFLRRGTHH